MSTVEENWKVLASLLPTGWQQMAWQCGAVGRLRGFPSPDVLLRMLMMHVARGYSLRETVVRAKLANWTDISDVALLKRLRNSEEWLRLLCSQLVRENVACRLEEDVSRTIRIVDGTIVKEPGKTGSQWRILYSIRLPSLACDFFQVTSTIGEGSGESLNRVPVGPHELILADAGYCSVGGIEYVSQHGADVLVRVNPQSFVAYSPCGRRISLLPRLRTLSKVGQFGEWRVVVHGQGSMVAGRLCAVRKREYAIQHAHRRLKRKASKKQMITRPETLEFAKYVIVFTTCSSGSTADVLSSYRVRWQIELVFKRLKSLAQLGHVPKHDERSARAWLYGKLLVSLLAQEVIHIGRDISPSGYSYRGVRSSSPSREFSFSLHQIQHAIEPHLSLEQSLYSWDQIAQALAESSRKRLLQCEEWNAASRMQRKRFADLSQCRIARRQATRNVFSFRRYFGFAGLLWLERRFDEESGLPMIAATRPQAAAAESHNPGTARLPVM